MNEQNWQERVSELESRLAFQDDTVDQLNQAIVHQNDRIAALESELRKAREQLEMLMPLLMSTPGDEPPPPHY